MARTADRPRPPGGPAPDPAADAPSTDSDDPEPPFHIKLQAWAVDIAADLHRRFGAEVALTVGAMAYPDAESRSVPDLDPASDEIAAELHGPLTVASGHDTSHGLLVTNRTATTMRIHTNGGCTAAVVDPATGRGYAVPPGDWAVRATLDTADHHTLTTAALPMRSNAIEPPHEHQTVHIGLNELPQHRMGPFHYA